MVSRITSVVVVVIVLFATASGRSSAAPQAPAGQGDVLSSLLVEVRGLRAAMETLASAGPRVQLVFGRLQLQEQRITGLTRRAETIREKILPAMRDDETLSARLKTAERVATGGVDFPEERKSAEQELPGLRRAAARASQELQRLQAEEMEISGQIVAEQGRWIEINRALEELERSLARR